MTNVVLAGLGNSNRSSVGPSVLKSIDLTNRRSPAEAGAPASANRTAARIDGLGRIARSSGSRAVDLLEEAPPGQPQEGQRTVERTLPAARSAARSGQRAGAHRRQARRRPRGGRDP